MGGIDKSVWWGEQIPRFARNDKIAVVLVLLRAQDHNFCGFNQGGGGLTFFQAHFAGGVGGDNCRDVLAADGESHLCQQAFDFEVDDAAYELISSADVAELGPALRCKILARSAIKMTVKFTFRNAMVSALGLNGS